MFYAGEKVKYCNGYAIVLSTQDEEVLLIISKGYIKWVDKSLVELVQTA